MPVAYPYIRFSTAEQRHGDSERRQTELSEEYARLNNLELDDQYELHDFGVSAFDQSNITKGAFGRFIGLVRDKTIKAGSYLLVESLDRVSRAKVMDAVPIFLELLNAGINIVTLNDKKIYSRNQTNDNWLDLVSSIMILSRATEESSIKSFRIRQSWDAKRSLIAENRLTSRCPAWLKATNGENGFELIPERAELIKQIFKMALDGMGNHTIVKRLNEEKIPTFVNYKKERKTTGWYDSYIQKIFDSTATYGEFQPYTQRDGVILAIGDPIPNYFPKLITKEQWFEVKAIRSNRRTKGGVHKGERLSNLFSGLLKCGYCGGTMVMGGYVNKATKKGERNRSRFVACNNAKRGLGCKYKQWNYPELEENLLLFSKSVDFSSIISDTNPSQEKVNSIDLEISRLNSESLVTNKAILNLVKSVEEAETVAPTQIFNRISELNIKLDETNRRIENLKATKHQIIEQIKSAQNNHIIIHNVINKINTASGMELHDLRLKISSLIKQHISEIRLYPLGGSAGINERIEETKAKLEEIGVPTREIEEMLPYMFEPPTIENKTIFIAFKNNRHIYYRNGFVREISENNFSTLLPAIDFTKI